MEKKYWKVYAKCFIAVNPIQEVDEEYLYKCIQNDIFEYAEFPDDFDSFDPNFDKIIDSYVDKIMKFFNEACWLDFGDFRIIYCSEDDDMLRRPNMCGSSIQLLLE